MIQRSDRQTGVPLLISKDKKAVSPKRIQLTQKHFSEFWVQELLINNPEILPIERLETVFAPAIPIGREVGTSVGPIDNLYISPQGYITIVETKLWRNPEARREVIGQIVDYAQDMSTWNFEKLDMSVKQFNKKYNKSEVGIIETIRKYTDLDPSEESDLIDTITQNLQKGRFLLLIAGDGIREEVEALADFLNSSAQLQFTFSLVELHVYQLNPQSESDLLVIPQIVMRTREVSRAVVTVDDSLTGKVKVNLNIAEKPQAQSRISISEEEYFKKLGQYANQNLIPFTKQVISDVEALGCVIEWKSASFVVKYPDPLGNRINLTLFVAQKNGAIYIGWLKGQLKSLNLNEQIAIDFVAKSAALFNKQINPKYKDSWIGSVTLNELSQKYGSFKKLIADTIEKINAASESTPAL